MRRFGGGEGKSLCAVLSGVGLLVALGWGLGPALAAGADPFQVAVSREQRDGRDVVKITVGVPEGHYLYAAPWRVSVDSGTLEPIDVPAPKTKHDPLLDEEITAYVENTTFLYGLSDAQTGALRVTVNYQGCGPDICFRPESREFLLGEQSVTPPPASPASEAGGGTAGIPAGFRLAGRAEGFLPPAKFIAFLARVEAGQGTAPNRLAQLLARGGVWLLVLAVLGGGFLLNLTPCVLPMIPINLAIIGAGAQAGSKRRGFALGAVYGVGMAFVYGILGVVVVLAGATFGTLNASPLFSFGVAIVFVLLGLAMFDVFTVDLSRFQRTGGGGSGQGSRFVAALLFGGLAALLAGACVAPVLISVLLLSTDLVAGGQWAGLALPFLLGVGMALPWPFAGAGLSFLPKPGGWMNHVKHGFGVLIFLFALWYARAGVRQWQAARPGAAEQPPVEVSSETETIPWIHDLAEGVTRAQAENRPMVIDFWATWCKSCKQMDKTTFRDPLVISRLQGYVPVKFQAEDPRASRTAALLDALGVVGLPSYVVLTPGAFPDDAPPPESP